MIAAEEIDILVNLNGYFGALRMGVFAHQPAPSRSIIWVFPARLGAAYMDYILADRDVIPDEERAIIPRKWCGCRTAIRSMTASVPIAGAASTRAPQGLPDG